MYELHGAKADPGAQPGMVDHAPTGWVVAGWWGRGPGADHRFSRASEHWAEGTTYDALILRFTAPYMAL